MLDTYIVQWEEKNLKHPDRQIIRETRVLTNSLERAKEYVQENNKTFLKVIEVKQEARKTTVCACCGQITHKNFI